MLFQTHVLLGVTFFLLVTPFIGGGNVSVFFFLVLLGSILPDIDSKNSKINRWAGPLGKLVTYFVRHRGMFHSFFLHWILFMVTSYFFGVYYGAALFLGYLAHALGDCMTPMGVRIFYPFSSFRLRGPIRTGSFKESVIAFLLLVILVKIFLFFIN